MKWWIVEHYRPGVGWVEVARVAESTARKAVAAVGGDPTDRWGWRAVRA
jgi:hypothetical protein